jgi:hypothetical protein
LTHRRPAGTLRAWPGDEAFDVVPFDVRLMPAVFVKAANTLSAGVDADPDGACEGT